MIPGDPEAIKKLKELAERNIANGDWGEEISIPGLGETVPITQEERETKGILAKRGATPLPKKKP